MRIGRFKHKGLRRLYEEDDPRGIPVHAAGKIKAILAALEFGESLAQVMTVPGWRLHPLKGVRKGEFAITVTANWRITFRMDGDIVMNLNFEDYH